MNRIMLLGLLVCISRVALCGVMGVMAETVARRAGSIGLRGLCRRFSSSRIFSSGSRCRPPARPCAARAGGTMQTAPPIR